MKGRQTVHCELRALRAAPSGGPGRRNVIRPPHPSGTAGRMAMSAATLIIFAIAIAIVIAIALGVLNSTQ